MDARAQQYLDTFLNTLSPEQRRQYTRFSADYFCADEYNANLCAQLIKQGEKRASCSMDIWYSQEAKNAQKPATCTLSPTGTAHPIALLKSPTYQPALSMK